MTANSSTFPSWLPSPALRQLRRLASEDVTQVTSVLMKAAQPLAHCNLELKQQNQGKKNFALPEIYEEGLALPLKDSSAG